MFRLVKWGYELGQRQERQRIKIAALNAYAGIVANRSMNDTIFKDNSTPMLDRQRVERYAAIDTEVSKVLDELLKPQQIWTQSSESILDGGQ